MQRKISAELSAWKNSKNRKPLLLNGARQVGKTYTLDMFAKANFSTVIYLNMEIVQKNWRKK